MAFKGIIISKENKANTSPNVFVEHLLPPTLRRNTTGAKLKRAPLSYAQLSNELMKDTRPLQSKYQALKSLLIAFIKENANKPKDEAYHSKKNALAGKVLTTGTQLHAIYNLFAKDSSSSNKVFSDLNLKKKKLTNELFYCEYLMDTPHHHWENYKKDNEQIQDVTIDSIIRFVTAETNWYRLFMIRVKRLFTNIMPLIKSLNYQWFVYEINRINPILSYVAWLFYVPRLTANLYSLILHTYPGFWMGEEEKAIHFQNRWGMHWERLWFELLNDAVWLAVGVACCFFLGPAGSTLLTAGLYFFDAAMAYTNYYFSTKHHETLRETLSVQSHKLNKLLYSIQSTNKKTDKTQESFEGTTVIEELSMLKEYQNHINLWIEYEHQKLVLSMFVTTMFSISMAIGALPTLLTLSASLAIACPIISACIVVSVCIAQYILSSKIEASCPESNVLELEQLEAHLTKPREKQTCQPKLPSANNDSHFFKPEPVIDRKPMRRAISCHEELLRFTSESEPLKMG